MAPKLFPVHIISWPVLARVSARADGRELARWDLGERPTDIPASHPGFSVRMPWTERAPALVRMLESNQDYLRSFFGTDEPVCLKLEVQPQERAEQVLGAHGLNLSALTLADIDTDTPAELKALSDSELFELLVSWSCEMEGASRDDDWVRLAHPERAELLRSFALAEDWRSTETDDRAALLEAQSALRALCDPPLAEFTFGDYLRWLYYHRTELAGLKPYPLRALMELRQTAK